MKGFEISNYIDEQLELNRNRDPSYRRYSTSLFPSLSDATAGFNPGLYIVVSDPNIGKSCALQTLCVDISSNNENTRSLFYTLDDSVEEMTKRFIATASFFLGGEKRATEINNAFYGTGNKNFDIHMGAVTLIQDLYRSGRLYMRDLMKISTTDELIDDIIEQLEKDNRDTVVFIDSALTLEAKGKDNNADKKRAIDIKRVVAMTKAPVFITAEKKKDEYETGIKRVDMRDISGSAKMAFVANFVLSFSYKDKDKFFNKEGENWNIVDGYISKNKVGKLRGVIPFESHGQFASIIEKIEYDF